MMCVPSRLVAFVFTSLFVVASLSARAEEKEAQPKPSIQELARIVKALSQWEAASQDVVSPTDEDKHVAYMVHKSKSSGHEIAVALEFQAPVRLDDLQKKYRWQQAAETNNGILLTAEPVEEIEQLFYRGFELQLDAATNLPKSIRFIDRNGKPKDEPLKLAVKARQPIEGAEIKLTSAESPRIANKPPEPSQQTEPKIAEITPELEKLLRNWETASSNHRTLDFQFTRRVYDTTWHVEKLSRGRIYYEAPNKVSIELEGISPGVEVSSRKDSETGENYSLERDTSAHWVWNGTSLLIIEPGEKTAQRMKLPEQPIPENEPPLGFFNRLAYRLSIVAEPACFMPLTLGPIKAEVVRKKFQLEVTQRDSRGLCISAKPMTERGLMSVSKFSLILDEATHLPHFAKYIDPTGNIETVFSFTNWKVNEPLADGDRPLVPNLDGYRIHASPIEFQPAKPNKARNP